jgi:hypothetical protein
VFSRTAGRLTGQSHNGGLVVLGLRGTRLMATLALIAALTGFVILARQH